MTSDLQSDVLDPPAKPARPDPAGFDLADTVDAIRDTARRDPAAALLRLNQITSRQTLALLDLSTLAIETSTLSGWSRPDPDVAETPQNSTLAAAENGGRVIVSGRQTVRTTGPDGGSLLLIAADGDERGGGRLLLLEPGPHVHVDEPIFGRSGFRERWVDFAEPFDAEPLAALTGASLRAAIAQAALLEELLHTALDLGILDGFWAAARQHVTTRTRPWQGQALAKATEDPHLLRRYGEYAATLHAAEGLLEEAAAALANDTLPGAVEAVAAARSFALLAGRTLISGTIELLGASATSERYGFDLFWRDFTAHAVAHPPLWPNESIGRDLLHTGKQEPRS